MQGQPPFYRALQFFNALHQKDADKLLECFHPGGNFQDVLPNGTIVYSAKELMQLHVGFMKNPTTAFRPFDRQRQATDGNQESSSHRAFEARDLESIIEFTSGCFCRVAAEVNRPVDFRDEKSVVARYYMHLGVLVKDNYVVHVQNTLFDPAIQTAR